MKDPREIARRLVTGTEVCVDPLSASEWSEVEALVRHERIEGYRHAAILDGRMAATAAQATAAEERLVASMERAVAIEALVGRIADEFGAHDVQLVALKGLAACRLDRERPELRSFFDADMLVKSECLGVAYRVLEELGFRRRFVEPAPGFDAKFGKGTAFVDDERRELDLHRTLAMGSLGISVVTDELWEGLVPIEIAGREVFALSAEARLLHACVHAAASIEPPRWHTLLDIREIEARGFSAERAATLARSWRYDAVVQQAIELHDEHLGPDGIDRLRQVASTLRPTRLQGLTLAGYRRRGTGYASRSLLALPVIDGWRERFRFAQTLLTPSRDYVKHHHRSRRSRWRSAARDIRTLLRSSR